MKVISHKRFKNYISDLIEMESEGKNPIVLEAIRTFRNKGAESTDKYFEEIGIMKFWFICKVINIELNGKEFTDKTTGNEAQDQIFDMLNDFFKYGFNVSLDKL